MTVIMWRKTIQKYSTAVYLRTTSRHISLSSQRPHGRTLSIVPRWYDCNNKERTTNFCRILLHSNTTLTNNKNQDDLENETEHKRKAKENVDQQHNTILAISDKKTTSNTIQRLMELSRPEAKRIGLAAATLGVTSSVTLLLPTASGHVIDAAMQAIQGDNPAALSPTLVALGLFSLVSLAGGGVYVRSRLLQQAGNNIVSRTKRNLFRSVLSQEAAYFDAVKKGDILSRLTTDAQLIQGAVTTQAVSVLRGIVMSAGSTFMLFQTSTTLALVSLCTLPPMFIAAKLVGQKLRDKQLHVQNLHSLATSRAEETISCIQTVTQFVAERHELERYSKAVTKAHDAAIQVGKTQAIFDGAIHVGAHGAILCVLGVGGTMVLEGTISAGDLTGFLMYSLLFAGNVSGISGTYAEMMKAVAASDRVFEVIDRRPSIPSVLLPGTETITTNYVNTTDDAAAEDGEHNNNHATTDATIFSTHDTPYTQSSILDLSSTSRHLSVEFRNVNFSYPERPDRQILGPKFSLAIRPGEVMALVGGSGSGKSTVAALLTRMYDVDNNNNSETSPVTTINNNSPRDGGGIFVDGHDLRDIDPSDLRSCVGIVSQEPLLFDGTIYDNIRYGRRSASDDEVVEAARMAHVLEFAKSFPDGLHTQVGSRGAQLSGGQKQRVAIARLCIKDPPIVVFDEATSALDAKSEYHVKEAINTVMKGRTVISIAHRLSTIRGADRIAVLHEGIIAEVGTYDELVQKEHGAFRSLMGSQIV